MMKGTGYDQNGIIKRITQITRRKPMSGLECPACSASDLEMLSEGLLECNYCGTNFESSVKRCPVCERINLVDVEYCIVCGEPLSIVSKVISRHDGAGFQPVFLEHARSRATDLKEKGAAASERRMSVLQDIDDRRELAQAEAREFQRKSDQRSIRIAFILAALFMVFVISIAAIYNIF
jgi:Zn ribbon nucleic-acid-binding protein